MIPFWGIYMIRKKQGELVAYAANKEDARKALDLIMMIERTDGEVREITEDELLKLVE